MAPEFSLDNQVLSLPLLNNNWPKVYPKMDRQKYCVSLPDVQRNSLSIKKYTYSPTYVHFGSWKKPRYAKIALVGLY